MSDSNSGSASDSSLGLGPNSGSCSESSFGCYGCSTSRSSISGLGFSSGSDCYWSGGAGFEFAFVVALVPF